MKRETVSTLLKVAAISSVCKTEYEISSSLIPIGFELLNKVKVDSGYDAIICRSTQTKDIVLFHIGTDLSPMQQIATNMNDIVGIINAIEPDVTNNLYIFLQKNIPQVKDALNVFDNVLKQYPDATITQAGYSLGGFMAQICYAYSTKKIDTLVLEAPGASEIIKKYYPNFKEEERGNLEYYYRPYNAINSYGTRILAESHPINVITPFSIIDEDSPFDIETSFGTKFFNYLAYTLVAHDIVKISRDFEQIDNFQQVTNWPSSVLQGFQIHLSANNKPHWEKVVEFKIYPDIVTKFNQPKSTKLLSQVTEFFNNQYLATSPTEFNWKLYTTNIDAISDAYYSSTQQWRPYSLLSKTQEFFCLSCCCYLYIPFKILKAGYNYLTNKTKTVNSLQNGNTDDQQALILPLSSNHLHKDTVQCVTEEIICNPSEFQYLLKLDQASKSQDTKFDFARNLISDWFKSEPVNPLKKLSNKENTMGYVAQGIYHSQDIEFVLIEKDDCVILGNSADPD
jgi:hypothetical protein